MPSEEMPERIWLDADSYNGAVGFAHPEKHKRDGWAAYIRADLCASGQQVRAVQEAADRDADRCAERIAELEAALEKARAEAKRMDLARDQFLGERNMLAETLREIQRGDMTGMMELTEAEVAKARATWAIKRIGTPVAALTPAPQPAGEAPPTCVACEDNPKHPNIPCAVCGAHPPQPSETVAEAALTIAMVTSNLDDDEDLPTGPCVILRGDVDAVREAARLMGQPAALRALKGGAHG